MNTNSEEKGYNEIDFSKNREINNFYFENKQEITIDLGLKEPIPSKDKLFNNIFEKNLSVSQIDLANILSEINKLPKQVVITSIQSEKINENDEKNKSIFSSLMIDLKEESSYDLQKVNTDYKTKKLESTINRDLSRKIDEKKEEEQAEIKKKRNSSSGKFNCGSCDIF